EQRERADLEGTLDRLSALIDPAAPLADLSHPLQDPRYDTPFGGLYWQVTDIDNGDRAASRSLWDFALRMSAANLSGDASYSVIAGPSGQTLTLLTRLLRYPAANKSYVAMVAEDRAALNATIGQFSGQLALALAILAAVLIAAAWLQVMLGLRPLKA